jgi:hypothetical protein
MNNFIFILSFFRFVFSLKNIDLCTRGSNQPYSMICGHNYSFSCKYNMCSVNREACDQYNDLTSKVKSIRITVYRPMVKDIFRTMVIKRFKAFLKRVPICSPYTKPNDQQEANVCSNKRSYCILSILNFNAKILRNRDCSCTGSHNYSCGRFTFICSLNRNECERFESQKSLYTYKTVKNCEKK